MQEIATKDILVASYIFNEDTLEFDISSSYLRWSCYDSADNAFWCEIEKFTKIGFKVIHQTKRTGAIALTREIILEDSKGMNWVKVIMHPI
jgi:hypothetical protein